MKDRTIKELVNSLGKDKDKLLDDVHWRVKYGVKSLGVKKCFSVIEVKSYGRKEYNPPTLSWGQRFTNFCLKKNYEGNQLDSPVTEKVLTEVSEAFHKYYQDKSSDISEIISKDIATNDKFINSLANTIHQAGIVQASKKVIKSKLNSLISSALHSAQAQAITAQVVGITGSLVTQVASSAVGKIILKQILIYSKIVIAKILGSAAFKTMLGAAIKKFAFAAILAAVTNVLWGLLGAKVAAAIGSAIVPIIAIGILGWVAVEIASMPEKLGEKLADEIKRNMSNEIDKINHQMANNIYEKIGENFGSLAAKLVVDKDFQESLNSCFD